MVELTHGGTWMQWRGLSRRDRNWALLSYAATMLAGLPIGLLLWDWSYRTGFRLGSGGAEPDHGRLTKLLESDLFSYSILASLLCAVVAAFAWWRFSRNQDEMFNRIQNYAVAQGSSWTVAIAFLWWVLSLGRWVPPMPMGALVALGLALILIFWFHAVRRWL